MIRQEGNKWVLYNRAGTKVLGRHPSSEAARRQEAAIQISKAKRKHGAADLLKMAFLSRIVTGARLGGTRVATPRLVVKSKKPSVKIWDDLAERARAVYGEKAPSFVRDVEQVAAIGRRSGVRLRQVRYQPGGQSGFDPGGAIQLGSRSPEVAAHEIGHAADFALRGVKSLGERGLFGVGKSALKSEISATKRARKYLGKQLSPELYSAYGVYLDSVMGEPKNVLKAVQRVIGSRGSSKVRRQLSEYTARGAPFPKMFKHPVGKEIVRRHLKWDLPRHLQKLTKLKREEYKVVDRHMRRMATETARTFAKSKGEQRVIKRDLQDWLRAETGKAARSGVKKLGAADLLKFAGKAKQPPASKVDDARIEKNKQTSEARRPHKFRAAKWTHPNGHPRCAICGREEQISGMCEGLAAVEKQKTAAVKTKYTPYPHQAKSIKQLIDNDGVIVMAHGTGTGKGFSAVVGFEVLRGLGKATRALVVTPTPLRANFYNDTITKFTTSDYQVVGSMAERKQGHKYIDEVKPGPVYTVVGYEMFRKDPVGLMKSSGSDTLIFDEFHKARDPGGKTWRAAMQARQVARNFIGLTASLVNNDPNEIAPLLQIALSGKFLTKAQFDRLYKHQTGKSRGFFGGAKKTYSLQNVKDLQRRIGPVLSYVDVDDIRPEDMPRRTVKTVDVVMSPHQRTLYEFALRKLPESTREKIRHNLPLSQKEAMNVFTMIIQARQASNALHVLDKRVSIDQSAKGTPKVKQLLDDAVEHLDRVPDGKVVLFSNLVRGGVDVLHAGLTARGIPHGIFIGKGRQLGVDGKKVTGESRRLAVAEFQAGKTRAIILSGAGAEGLDLKNATLFQALDGHFNPERILQAEARVRRLKGQAHRPPEERVVEVRRYRSVLPKPGFFARVFGGSEKEFSTDEWVYATAQRKHILNRMLRNAVRTVSLSVPKGEPPKIPIPRAPAPPKPVDRGPTRPEPRPAPPRSSVPPVEPRPQPEVARPAGRPASPTPPVPLVRALATPPTPKVPRHYKYIRRYRDPRTGEYRYVYPKRMPKVAEVEKISFLPASRVAAALKRPISRVIGSKMPRHTLFPALAEAGQKKKWKIRKSVWGQLESKAKS